MEVNINVRSQRPSALVTDRHNKIENLKHVSNIIAVSRYARMPELIVAAREALESPRSPRIWPSRKCVVRASTADCSN